MRASANGTKRIHVECLRTSLGRQRRQPIAISHRQQEKHQRAQIARSLKGFPCQIEPPHRQRPIAKRLPLDFGLVLGHGACDLRRCIEVVEREGKVEFVVGVGSYLERKFFEV